MEMISKVENGFEGLYFIFNSEKGRYVECFIEYDEEQDELIVWANDYIVGRI